MKKIISVIVMVAMLLCCASVVAEGDALKLAVIYSATIDDKGWCQAMDSGIKTAIEQGYNIDYTYIEKVAIADANGVIENLVGDYDIILVHGAQFSNALMAVAEENPEQIFVIGTSDKILGDNIFTYMPASEEPGYLNGYMAGLMTKSNKVGVVGSANSGDAYRYVRGFILGYRAANPNSTEDPMVTWTGSFDDTVGAGDIAGIMISAGCDVLTGSSQQAIGALRKVAAAENVAWVAQTLAQMEDFPEATYCAADYDYSAVIINVIEQMNAGVTGGMCITMTYSNNGFMFRYSDVECLVPAEVSEQVSIQLENLVSGDLVVDFDSVILE